MPEKQSLKEVLVQIQSRFFRDKVSSIFSGIFILLGIITLIFFSLSAKFLAEQIQVMTTPAVEFSNPLISEAALNTQAAHQAADALGLEEPNF